MFDYHKHYVNFAESDLIYLESELIRGSVKMLEWASLIRVKVINCNLQRKVRPGVAAETAFLKFRDTQNLNEIISNFAKVLRK